MDSPAGTERLVAELVEITTARMTEAFVAGFKQGVTETLRIINEAGALTPETASQVEELLTRWQDEEDTNGTT
jgi:hypothetical protein